MANAIIPHQPQGWIIKVEALRLSKLAVKEQIRARGESFKRYEPKQITAMAEEYWFAHRAELIGQATISMLMWAERKSKHLHSKAGPEKSEPCAVRMSRSKVEASS